MASTEWVRVRQQQLMVQDMYDEYAETYDEELCGKGGLGYRTPKLLEAALLSRAEKPAPAPSLPSATTASATTSPPRASSLAANSCLTCTSSSLPLSASSSIDSSEKGIDRFAPDALLLLSWPRA